MGGKKKKSWSFWHMKEKWDPEKLEHGVVSDLESGGGM